MFPVCDVIPPRTSPIVTISLLIVNTLTFVYQLLLDRHEVYDLARAFGVVPTDLLDLNLLTGAFFHQGWIHYAVNMMYLWIFGPNVEDSMGHAAFLCFYLAVGALAALAHTGLHASSAIPLIGASSAVAGVMGAYFVLFPKSQVLMIVVFIDRLDVIEAPAILFPGAWLLLQLASGIPSLGADAADAGVAVGAHLTGLAAGVAAGGLVRWRGRGGAEPSS
jgi:membrane associated rhomboid family serine protease